MSAAPTFAELEKIAQRAGVADVEEILGILPTVAELEQMVSSARRSYAESIRAHLIQSVESVLAIGDVLIEAKKKLPHGDFEAMVREDLRWTPQTARKFMAIGRHPVLSNRAHVRDLPPSWGTLAELARVKAPDLEKAITEKLVRPDMTREDTRELVYRRKDRERVAAHREALRVEQERRANRPPSPSPPPSPQYVLKGIGEEFGELVARLEILSKNVKEALASGAFGEPPESARKLPTREQWQPADLLFALKCSLHIASDRLGPDYDDVARMCGLLPTRDQA